MQTAQAISNALKRLPKRSLGIKKRRRFFTDKKASNIKAPKGLAPWLINQRGLVSIQPRPFLPQVPRLSNQTRAFSSLPTQISNDEFMKLIRKPPEFFGQLVEGVKSDLEKIDEIQGDNKLQELLTPEERNHYLETLFTNMGYSKPVAAHFMKSALGLPTMGASVYSHMFAGLTNYILSKHGDESPDNAVRFATYYRSPILVEELKRLGFNDPQIRESVAKAFFLQYWSGDRHDPLLFNPMVRSFYPGDSHITTGANDLGRELEFQAARLYAMGHEGMTPPVTVINTGDTGPFTDGAMHALQHLIEASEKGFPMPIIFLVNANNSSISARLDQDSSEDGLKRIEDRFKAWGGLINPGFTTGADDVSGGITAMRKAVDQVLETGKPTYCISSCPFRPLGHASDGSPASDQLLKTQFDAFKDLLVTQISAACDPGTKGVDIAKRLDKSSEAIQSSVNHALTGNKVLTRSAINALSVPGAAQLKAQPGELVDLPLGYLLGKGQKRFAGMGADIYGKAIDTMMGTLGKEGREVRYVHQENHRPNKTDTRGGVYGELNQVSDTHLDRNFIDFLPQEAQIAQVGAALRTVLPPGNVVIVKGPHTLFNEHARDHMKYAAFRRADTGQDANYIYLIDGGSLAFRETELLETDQGPIERDLVMARVGEHHNTPTYSGYAADANTLVAVPMDTNLFGAMLPALVNLHEMGRMVVGFIPTASFGQLHAAVDLPEITQNETLKVAIPGAAPSNGKQLAVVTWGPEAKMVAKTLSEQGIEATLFILSYIKAPNSLIAWLGAQAKQGIKTEVITVDPNPDAGLMSPVMTTIKQELGYPEAIHFSDCTVDPAFVPYGLGASLLNGTDLVETLEMRGFGSHNQVTEVTQSANQQVTDEVVMSPLDAEKVKVTFLVKPGDKVEADQMIAELESDKAVIEISAPISGILGEFLVPEQEDINVTSETKICMIVANSQDKQASPSVSTPKKQPTTASSASETPLSAHQLAMVDNMTVKPGDTKTYSVSETVNFKPLMSFSKQHQLSPVTLLVKTLANSVEALGLNKKLTVGKHAMKSVDKLDIGVAIEIEGQLRVAVIRDVANKSESDIKADIEGFIEKGPRLTPEDQNLESVCYVLTSLGKLSPESVEPTLPKGVTGILGIGRQIDGKSRFTFTLCHATLTGSEGASLLMDIAEKVSDIGPETPSVRTPRIQFRHGSGRSSA